MLTRCSGFCLELLDILLTMLAGCAAERVPMELVGRGGGCEKQLVLAALLMLICPVQASVSNG